MDIQARRAIAVDLSSEADFRLGSTLVSPSTRQLRCGKARVTLEPRVMQLLVVLAQAKGEVVSRDELVLRCWDGVVVGDNAINRVVSLLRAAAADSCGGTFRIDTIKKVGYRLVVGSGNPVPSQLFAAAPAPLSRRGWIAGAGALLALGATGALVWRGLGGPPREAKDLFERGLLAQKQGLLSQTEQAIAFLTEAVKIDPDYAQAWGALALSYRHRLVDDYSADPVATARLIEGAAGRALALAPDNADAHVARLLSRPAYRRWVDAEAAYRDMLTRFPNHWLLRGSLGRLMYDVGRWGAGVPLFKANVKHDPFLPVSRISLGQGLWGLGRLQEAEQVFREALERWPKHYRVWMTAFAFFALSGRPAVALSFGGKPDLWPSDLPPHLAERNIAWARALDSGDPDQAAASVRTLLALCDEYPDTIPGCLLVLVPLGIRDQAFDLANRYFDAVPGKTGPHGGMSRRPLWRETDFLFAPPLAPLRRDPRFAALTVKTGLADYWRATRTAPHPPPFAGL